MGRVTCTYRRWSPEGDRLATGCWHTAADDNLPARIWDGQTGQLLMTLESHDGETFRSDLVAGRHSFGRDL